MGEFNVDKTTGDLIDTAGMPETYPASQVTYGNGSVEDALDELTSGNLGTGIDMKPYNTTANQYVCPSDGYLYLYARNSGSRLQATISQALPITTTYSNGIGAITLFLKKGMSIRSDSTGQANDLIEFYPLS